MTDQYKTELLYKKFLGTPNGIPGTSYVGELGSARTNLFAQTQLFSQPIPQIAPESTDFIVSGYVTLVGGKTTIVQTEPSSGKLGTIKTSKSYPWLQKIEYLQLQQATPFSYYFNNPVSSINLLQNIIPFNYDLGGSYNYALYKSGSNPSTQASLLPSNPPNWFIDSDAGYLYFPTAANDWSNFFYGLFPVISFYRYNGTMGIPTNLGNFAGAYSQGTGAIAYGDYAGFTGQGANSIAIGAFAGPTGMSANSIILNASGTGLAGTGPTGGFYVAPIASYSGSTGPFMLLAYGADKQIVCVNGAALTAMNIGGGGGADGVITGTTGSFTSLSATTIATSSITGTTGSFTSLSAISITSNTGSFINVVSSKIGTNAGSTNQGTNAIAFGNSAGSFNQGTNSIAIGAFAGPTGLTANSIVLNASGTGLAGTGPTGGFYVAPVASYSGSAGPFMLLAYGADRQIVSVTGPALTAMNIGGGGGAVGVTGSSYKTSWVASSAIGTNALIYSTMSPNGQYQIMPNNNSDGGFYYTTNGNTANPTWFFKSATAPGSVTRIVLISDDKNAVMMNYSYGYASDFENINFSASANLDIGVIVAAKGSSDLSTILATTYTAPSANGYYLQSGAVSTTPNFVNITPHLTSISSSNLVVNNNTTIGLSKDGNVCITALSTTTGSSLYFTSILKLSTASSISYTNSTGYTCENNVSNTFTIITLTSANSSIKVGMYISYIVGGSTTGSTNAFVTAISNNTIITLSANIIPSSQTITSIIFRTFAILDNVAPLPNYSGTSKSANEWTVVALSRGSIDTKYYMLVGGVNTSVYLGIYNTGTYLPTFTKTSLPQTNWQSYTISATGQYMYALTTTGIVYYSDSYGESWTSYMGPSDTSYNTGVLSLSDNGMYGLMSNNSSVNPIYNFNTVYTNTTGNALALGTNAGQTNQGAGSVAIGNSAGQTETALSYGSFATSKWFTPVSSSSNINSVACSASGQIQLYGRDELGSYNPYISKDSGQTFSVITSSDLLTVAQNMYAISADGNTIVIVTNATAYISPNTGASFPIRYTCGTGNETARAVAVSGEGQYIVIITSLSVYFSNNAGKTFTNVFSGTIMTASCAISYTGQYISTIINGNYYVPNTYAFILPSIYLPFESISESINGSSNIDGTSIDNSGPVTAYSIIKKIGSNSANFGNNRFLVIPMDPSATSFTLCCWVYFNSLNPSTGAGVIFSLYNNGDIDTASLADVFLSGSTIYSNINKFGTIPSGMIVGPSIAAATWYHVALTFNYNGGSNGTYIVYVNGAIAGQRTTGTLSTGYFFPNQLYMGRTSLINNNQFIDGYVDDFRYYKSVLNASQITQIYNTTTITVANTLALSPSGQYQAYTNSNNMNLSTNFGASYSGLITPTNINSLVISQNGQTLAYNDGVSIYYSSNQGASWFTINPTALTVPVSLAMSADGSYFITAGASAVYTLNTDAAGNSVAIGNSAGQTNQAVNAIAIGNMAGQINQPANTIVLNASGTALNPTVTNGCFIAPIATQANSTSTFFNLLMYGSDNQVVQSNNLKMDASGSITSGSITGGSITSSITTEAGQLRLLSSYEGNKYGVLFRHDGRYFYMMRTNANDPYGGWSTDRPFTWDLNSGEVAFATRITSNGITSTGGITLTSSSLTYNSVNIELINTNLNGRKYGIFSDFTGSLVFLDNSGTNPVSRLTITQDGNIGIGRTPSRTLDVAGDIRLTGELISTNPNACRVVYGSYGTFFRNDGGALYIMLTSSGDQYGGWNGLRPFYINLANGVLYSNNAQRFSGGMTACLGNGSWYAPNNPANWDDYAFFVGGGGGPGSPSAFNNQSSGLGIGYENQYNPGHVRLLALQPSIQWKEMHYGAHIHVFWTFGSQLCGYVNSGGFVSLSDGRAKRDVRPIKTTRSLERILRARPVTYHRIVPDDDKMIPDSERLCNHIGLIAQDVREFNPHAVDDSASNEKQEYLGIRYNDFVIHLIGAVQELHKKLALTEEKLALTEEKLVSTEEKLALTDAKLASTDTKFALTDAILDSTEEKLALTEEKLVSTYAKLVSTEEKLALTDAKLALTEEKLASTDAKLALTDAKLVSTEEKLASTDAKLASLQLSALEARLAAQERVNELQQEQINRLVAALPNAFNVIV